MESRCNLLNEELTEKEVAEREGANLQFAVSLDEERGDLGNESDGSIEGIMDMLLQR